MASSYNLRKLSPNDEWLVNDQGQIVGVQTPNGVAPFIPPGIAQDSFGNVVGLAGIGNVYLPWKKRSSISALVPAMPSSVTGAFTGTHNLMMTAPGDFDAVAAVALNYDTTAVATIDSCCVAVSERSDTSKTVPIIGGTQYNALAAAGTQLGWLPVTWSGSASIAVPAAIDDKSPTLRISDFIPLSSVPRVESGKQFPLVMCRMNFAARTVSAHVFPNAAEVDNFNTQFAPYEFYQSAQSSVDGVANPVAFTTTWSAGTSTQTMRIFGLAFRLRGTGDLILFAGDSITKGLGAAGNIVSNAAANLLGGWAPKSALALASMKKPVGYISAGVGGKTSTQYWQTVQDYSAILRPSICTYPVYSPNDGAATVTQLGLDALRGLDFSDYCYTNRTVPVFVTPVPYGGSGSEARRLAFVQKLNITRGMAGVIDANSAVYDPANAANNYFVAGSNVDDTHPSASGYSAIANIAAIPVLSKLVG